MKRPLAMAMLLGALLAAPLRSEMVPQVPHPAVVRVIAPYSGGATLGSGALVAVSESHGLVVTNWHVAVDATRPITVVFPDGFRSAAKLLRMDRAWDLAALAVWRPNVQPIPLATEPPRPGDVLWIAGYGRGSYRAAAGRCTQYLSPGGRYPFEMVELSTAARKGDSGGPILNARGELAGVLFGADFNRTTGSYCGRVRWFLASVADDFYRLKPNPDLLVQSGNPNAAPIAAIARRPASPTASPPGSRPPAGHGVANPPSPQWRPSPSPNTPDIPVIPASPPGSPIASPGLAASSRWERIKTLLAAVGAVSIFVHGLGFLVPTPKPKKARKSNR